MTATFLSVCLFVCLSVCLFVCLSASNACVWVCALLPKASSSLISIYLVRIFSADRRSSGAMATGVSTSSEQQQQQQHPMTAADPGPESLRPDPCRSVVSAMSVIREEYHIFSGKVIIIIIRPRFINDILTVAYRPTNWDVVATWRISRVEAFRSEGRGFESRSSRHVGTSGLWRFGVKLRHNIRAVSGALLSSSGLEEAL